MPGNPTHPSGLVPNAVLQRALDFLWKARILPWIAGPLPPNPQAPPSFPQETAEDGRPSGPHPLPFGWKAAIRLSTGLGIRFADPTFVTSQHQHQKSADFHGEPVSLRPFNGPDNAGSQPHGATTGGPNPEPGHAIATLNLSSGVVPVGT